MSDLSILFSDDAVTAAPTKAPEYPVAPVAFSTAPTAEHATAPATPGPVAPLVFESGVDLREELFAGQAGSVDLTFSHPAVAYVSGRLNLPDVEVDRLFSEIVVRVDPRRAAETHMRTLMRQNMVAGDFSSVPQFSHPAPEPVVMRERSRSRSVHAF